MSSRTVYVLHTPNLEGPPLRHSTEKGAKRHLAKATKAGLDTTGASITSHLVRAQQPAWSW